MKIGDELGYRLLRRLAPSTNHGAAPPASVLSYVPKIKRTVGEDGWDELRGKTVLDFGCGVGTGVVEMALHGAARVIGLDIRPDALEAGRRSAATAGVNDRCEFVESVGEPVDAIVTIDAFEHFADPAGVLNTMHGMLRDDGLVIVSFGPTWYHPRGGHLFSVFPWSHLVFSEAAQIRWRNLSRNDGATCFEEVEGGLNQMTIKRFVGLVERSDFRFGTFRSVPIRPLRWAHNRMTREFTTAVVECTLVKSPRRTGSLEFDRQAS